MAVAFDSDDSVEPSRKERVVRRQNSNSSNSSYSSSSSSTTSSRASSVLSLTNLPQTASVHHEDDEEQDDDNELQAVSASEQLATLHSEPTSPYFAVATSPVSSASSSTSSLNLSQLVSWFLFFFPSPRLCLTIPRFLCSATPTQLLSLTPTTPPKTVAIVAARLSSRPNIRATAAANRLLLFPPAHPVPASPPPQSHLLRQQLHCLSSPLLKR